MIANLTAVTSALHKQEQITLYKLAGVGETHCGNLMGNMFRLMGSVWSQFCVDRVQKEGIAYGGGKALGIKDVKRHIVMFISNISIIKKKERTLFLNTILYSTPA